MGRQHDALQSVELDYHYVPIGTIPPNHDISHSEVEQPSGVVIDMGSPLVLQFILRRHDVKSDFEEAMNELNASVAWPIDDTDSSCITLSCEVANIAFKFVRKWSKAVTRESQRFLRMFTIRHILFSLAITLMTKLVAYL